MKGEVKIMTVLVVIILYGTAWGFSGSGSGTESDPYMIINVEQLQEMQNDLDAWYVLGNDIDASDTQNWNGGTGFAPVGVFTGVFDGQGFSIHNLYINRLNTKNQGLFGVVAGGGTIIKNVNLINADIRCYKSGGSLAGLVWYSPLITNCSATGTLSVKSGLTFTGAGGLIGTVSRKAHVDQCFSGVNVNAGSSRQIGGLIGFIEGDSPPITYLTNSYSYGTVSGFGSKQGNLVGDADGPYVVIDRCYSCGYNKALLGNNFDNAVVTNSFWDKNKGAASSPHGGMPKTTTQMMQQSTFVGWDFINIWSIIENETYPCLRFEYGELVDLEIIGPNDVAENWNGQYQAIAHFEHGALGVTNLVEWSVEPNDAATIDETGLLETGNINRVEEVVTIMAEYTSGEDTIAVTKDVTIFPVCPRGSALDFDGENDYVIVNDNLILSPKKITLSAWIHPEDVSHNFQIIGKWIFDDNEYIFDNKSNNDALRFGADIGIGGSFVEIYSDDGVLTTNVWQHVAVTYDGLNCIFYVNGNNIGENNSYSGDLTDSDNPVYIGLSEVSGIGPRAFNGMIDEVRIYNLALTEEEIRDSMHIRLNGDEPGLVGYWNFNEGEGQAAYDMTVNANNGQLGGTDSEDDNDPEWVESDAPVGLCKYVAVDIKPGSCPNPLNVKSSGILPVAILGSEDVNIFEIVPTSIELAGVSAIRNDYEDVATPVWDPCDCNCTTYGLDGFLDLTLKFKTQDIVEAIGEVNDSQALELPLTGVLFDETPIEGADCVIIRGNHKPINKADFNSDKIVDFKDFAFFADNWLKSSIVED
jgi:hypothetical protein